MPQPVSMIEVWRGSLLESVHHGHAVIVGPDGEITEAWGDPEALIYPRSSCKMIQALPLLTSGAARAAGLGPHQLALACASHQGAALHRQAVAEWLGMRGLSEGALRCGCQPSSDEDEQARLIRAGEAPSQLHNNCSGKHAGFLTLGQHLGAGPEYLEIDHPVQLAARAAFEDVTGAESPLWERDGCSAPNFATTVHGLARAMGRFATAVEGRESTSDAMVTLREAMMTHPEFVAGKTRACTELMQAAREPFAVKTGAEGVYTAILPSRGVGIALKIADGTTRAAEAAITHLLVRLGVLDADTPAAQRRLGPIGNWRGFETGHIAAAATLG